MSETLRMSEECALIGKIARIIADKLGAYLYQANAGRMAEIDTAMAIVKALRPARRNARPDTRPDVTDTELSRLEIDVRVARSLSKAGVTTIDRLRHLIDQDELWRVPGIGKVALATIRRALVVWEKGA